MIAYHCIGFVALLLPLALSQGQSLMSFGMEMWYCHSVPCSGPQLRNLFLDLCPNSTFDKDVIDELVLGHINDQRYKLLRGLQLNGPWQGKDKWTSETQGYGKKLPKGKTMNKLVG
ncbi:hypothetical protein ANCCAN_30189 [Ancylostoma caninum]|uniref:Uncharacterized protein n=1 Tax=Ancylostoma caninum TaxID=29170 RepID=A0A368EWL3_ANCCA|nr:hypothetical protein ANCCAN_30189 [Ancylostoma caninum]